MDLLEKYKAFIKKENLFRQKDKLLIAVSGGVDSVVLCELCKQAEYDFLIAHCNFQLRGQESDRDEEFVKGLGEKYNVEVLVKKFDTENYSEQNKQGIQVAARELRYSWFRELLGSFNSPDPARSYILTAHHADDNIETLLMNFFKGTGINGLRGILPKQANIIRPLLFAGKDEIRTFAAAEGISFVEDSSNTSDKYTRNYFRNQLIPAIQKVFPRAEENLKDNLQRFREIDLLYRQSITSYKNKLLEQKGNEVHIPVLKLQRTEPLQTIVYEIIKDFGFTSHQTTDVIALLQSETGKYVQSGNYRIIKNRNWLLISPIETGIAQNILVEESIGRVNFAGGQLSFEMLSANSGFRTSTSSHIAQLDASAIRFPLLLRQWKQGDYFYPLGMNKKKKVSRFLTDQKLSLTQKEKVWVLEMNKKIIWIVGMRIDERFKLNPATKTILQLSLSVPQ